MEPDPVETLAAAVDGLLAADLSRLDAVGLVDLLRAVEVQVRQLAAVDHRLVAELDARAVGHQVGACSTADLLRQVLRVTAREAAGRVRAAADLGPRRTLTGDRLPPLFPAVATAQTAGTCPPRTPGSSPPPSTRYPLRSTPSTAAPSKHSSSSTPPTWTRSDSATPPPA